MPDFPIIDSHLHIWNPKALDYPWLAAAGKLNRAYLPADYRAACGTVEVEAMVFLECDAHPDRAFDEAHWVLQQARTDPRIAALVCFARLEQGDAVRGHLEKLAGIEKVVGVRRIYQDEPDTSFCLQPGFIEGVRALAEFGLSFDMCIKHPHLEASIELASQCPDTRIVLDHIGKPGIEAGLMEPWRTQMAELAACENVVCKLSGVATEADHEHWVRADLRPYIDVALDAFGPDRIMFGGDWPVATMAIEPPEWVSVVDEAVAHYSEAERRSIYRGTASRFYKLGIEA
ncbi:amidohydrolase family protein [Oricola indica]|uniref:amidohydrolase family protein n=1 Tax=Oricola indica TaxID=2872591 RepID=UPI003CCBDC83